jgi:hypothetical protein
MITESLGDVFARGVFVAVAFAMHANIPASLVHPATLSFCSSSVGFLRTYLSSLAP